MKRSFALAIPSMFLSLALLFVTSCTYVTPESENPNPGLEKSSTEYQVKDGILALRKSVIGYKINQEANTISNERKTWLCGWAPVTQSGTWQGFGGLSNTPYRSRHCNMEMRISKDGTNLEGRLLNLNFVTDYERWPLLFTIPINLHYFYEKDVDSRGRELNVYKKVSDRKNWKLAPIMDLDLKAIKFHDINRSPGAMGGSQAVDNILASLGGTLSDVFDVEILKEEKQQFIAFSGTLVNSVYGSLVQHVYRFNFLELKENPKFIKTPYDKRTANHMNILHILGNQPNGSTAQEVNWAAHWDVSKPVEFCLNNFPEDNREYKNIGKDVIEEMNKAMEKIGAVKKGQKAFKVSKKKYKYDFDLRCPAITWVDDPILSFRAPLGIGLVNTNIKTGEILWGGAVIWGGLIDYIVNRDSESVSDAMVRNTHAMLRDIESAKNSPYFEDLGANIQIEKWSRGFKNLKQLSQLANVGAEGLQGKQALAQFRDDIMKKFNGLEGMEGEAKETLMAELLGQLENIVAIGDLNIEGHDIAPFNINDSDVLFDSSLAELSENSFLTDLTSISGLQKNVAFTDEEKAKRDSVQSPNMTIEKAEELIAEMLSGQSSAIDAENTLDNHFDAVSVAVSNMGGLEKLAAAKSFIKNVTLHEFGHVVGLGHQFEGNRLPQKGMVPPAVYSELAEAAKTRQNYSSIMDYQSGHTEVSLPYKDVKMGVQDELTLRYLYKQEYSTYRSGDKDWTFFSVPANGVIRNETPSGGSIYYARYMPQCSDMEALLGTSPYCRRWDRGHDAPTLVEENLKEFTDSFISRLNSFTEATGGNPYWAKYRLWSATYNLMNYNRTFYDNMRYQLSDNPVYRGVFDKIKKNEKALLSFSKSCIDPSLAPNSTWAVEFTKLALEPLANEPKLSTLEGRQAGMTHSSYAQLYDQYKSVLGEANTREFSDEEFADLEERMNENGIAFSEIQKLCRASKKSLGVAKLLLSLKGPDHPIMNYNATIVPTGLRGGEATTDYSRMFGTYDQLGLLPLKIAALDVLTSTASTLQYGWWRIPKPIYNDSNDGKFGYFSMYPEEFTDVVGTAVKNNMGFGGTQLQDAASLSVANLYMNYFLFRTFFFSNDSQARGFQSNYIEELKAQTKFQVAMAPVLLDSIDIPNQPNNKRFGFRPKLFNMAERKLIDLPEAYVLPDKKVIIRGNDSQIILPLTKLRFLGQGAAYVWALEVTYDKTSYDDPLQGFTVKNAISELTNQELDKCISGATGLASFFNTDEEFEGFQIDPSIATDPDAQTNFEKSLDSAFDAYHGRDGLTPTQIGCEESLKGVGLITSTALSLNGYFLPHVYEYIKK